MKYAISVVVPVYNSSKSLEELCTRLYEILSNNCDKYEIILVDDFSIDDSWEKIKNLAFSLPNTKGIKLIKNFGQQNAVFCGMQMSSYPYIVTIDDDLQHKPEDIPFLLAEIQKGYDMVYGVYKIKHHSLYRNIGSKLTNYLFDIILKKPKNIKISSFRIITRELSQKITSQNRGYVYISASAFRKTKKIQSIYVTHNQRKYGHSNYNPIKLIKIFLKIFIYYSHNPICTIFRKNELIYEIEETTDKIKI